VADRPHIDQRHRSEAEQISAADRALEKAEEIGSRTMQEIHSKVIRQNIAIE
jgi:hypothetical protein